MAVSVIYEPIPWIELDAYANRNRVGDWELKYIYAMSKMFCDSYNHHKNKRLPAPYIKDGWDMDSLMIKAAYQKAMQRKKAKASKWGFLFM